MKRKSMWLIVFLIVVGIFLFFYFIESSKHTSFGEVTSEMLETESIQKIMISDNNGKKAFDISDVETIKSLIEKPNELGLKKIKEIDGQGEDYIYNLHVYNEEYKSRIIKVNKNTLRIGANYYSVKGENIFYKIVDGIYKQPN